MLIVGAISVEYKLLRKEQVPMIVLIHSKEKAPHLTIGVAKRCSQRICYDIRLAMIYYSISAFECPHETTETDIFKPTYM